MAAVGNCARFDSQDVFIRCTKPPDGCHQTPGPADNRIQFSGPICLAYRLLSGRSRVRIPPGPRRFKRRGPVAQRLELQPDCPLARNQDMPRAGCIRVTTLKHRRFESGRSCSHLRG